MPRSTPVPAPHRPQRGNGHDMDAVGIARMLVNSTLLDRAALFSRLGKSYYDSSTGLPQRDLYEALGYPVTITNEMYMARYSRGDIAARIVEAPVDECWRLPPQIVEDEDDETQTAFEKAFTDLNERVGLLEYIERADLLAGLGRFSVLLLGYDDTDDLRQPAQGGNGRARELLYLAPYAELSVEIESYVLDPADPRYKLPEFYKLRPSTFEGESVTSEERSVHWSRVIHVAEGLLEDDVFGTPRLKAVWNRLEDLQRTVGGSGEMFWRGAFPGMGFLLNEDAAFPAGTDSQGRTAREALEDEIKEYIHGLKRYLKVQGMDVEQWEPQVADPSKHVDVQIQMISSVTRIPKRILVGSERGELASKQDDDNWLRFCDGRRRKYLERRPLRGTVNRLIEHGVLPTPADGYTVRWPPLQDASAEEQAAVGQKRADTIGKYASAPGADLVLPRAMFLEHVLGLDKELVKLAMAEIDQMMAEEEREMEEERRATEQTQGQG